MGFLLYDYACYKKAIKDRVKDLKTTKAKYSLQYLSTTLDIQYTFLSKVLNSDSHHLNEDQIFSLGHTLEFLEDEIEYLLLLRSHQATSHSTRKNFLHQKISTLQKHHRLSLDTAKAAPSDFGDDMRYLMDYQVLVAHVALTIKHVQKNPHLICSVLGIDRLRLKEILNLLDRTNRIEVDPKSGEIKKVLHSSKHFGKDHPLTRTHQLVMKTALNQLSFTKSEHKKENLFVTFTTNPEGFEKIKAKIKEFTSEIQQITFDHKHTGVYQMNLDFLEVFDFPE